MSCRASSTGRKVDTSSPAPVAAGISRVGELEADAARRVLGSLEGGECGEQGADIVPEGRRAVPVELRGVDQLAEETLRAQAGGSVRRMDGLGLELGRGRRRQLITGCRAASSGRQVAK